MDFHFHFLLFILISVYSAHSPRTSPYIDILYRYLSQALTFCVWANVAFMIYILSTFFYTNAGRITFQS